MSRYKVRPYFPRSGNTRFKTMDDILNEYRRGGWSSGYSYDKPFKTEISSYGFPRTPKAEYNMREPVTQSERMIETKPTQEPEIKESKIESNTLEKSEPKPETKKKIETPADMYDRDIIEMGW